MPCWVHGSDYRTVRNLTAEVYTLCRGVLEIVLRHVLIGFGERQDFRFGERASVEADAGRRTGVGEAVDDVERWITGEICHGEMPVQRTVASRESASATTGRGSGRSIRGRSSRAATA